MNQLNPEDKIELTIQIDLIRSKPGYAAQDWHKDEPVQNGCPSRLHLCIATTNLDDGNGIEYQFNNGKTATLNLRAGEVAAHTSDVRLHRGLANASEESRVNCFVTVQPSNLAVDFVV